VVPYSIEDAALATRLERIQKLADELAKVRNDAVEQQALAEKIHREIEAGKTALKLLP
jgi:hypothetical protein